MFREDLRWSQNLATYCIILLGCSKVGLPTPFCHTKTTFTACQHCRSCSLVPRETWWQKPRRPSRWRNIACPTSSTTRIARRPGCSWDSGDVDWRVGSLLLRTMEQNGTKIQDYFKRLKRVEGFVARQWQHLQVLYSSRSWWYSKSVFFRLSWVLMFFLSYDIHEYMAMMAMLYKHVQLLKKNTPR